MSLLIMGDDDCEIGEAVRLYDEGYKEGLKDAWNAARRIDTNRDIEDYVFGDDLKHGFNNISASEAIAKIKEYDEIRMVKVGDEVYFADESHPRVVTSIFTDNGCNPRAVQITESGKYCVDDVTELKKTGRHFPQIAEVLGQLKGEQND